MIEIKKGQKYQLVLHLVEKSDDMSLHNKCLEFVFDETEFVTVSCHQNQVSGLFSSVTVCYVSNEKKSVI